MSFDGKAVIVTGATSRMGRATAEAVGREGAGIVIVGGDDSVRAAAAAAARRAGGRPAICRADVTAHDAPDRVVARALDAFGAIDVLVNAAGVIARGTLDATSDAVWDTMMAVNARAPFRLMRA